MALGSLLSVALSSTAGKQFHFTISGGFFYPLKFKIVLDMGYTSRKLYLFDTFDGFDRRDVHGDDAEGAAADQEQFSDTSEQLVLSRMKYPENCVIKKGYFPESFTDVQDTFCYVSIDFDLYQPIYKGLDILWDHLSPGGFIMVHDYQNTMFPGSRRAVRQFCAERYLQLIPLSDTNGSALIVKHK